MRFIVDECTGRYVAAWLKSIGHDVFSVYEAAPGSSDDEVIQKAVTENRILITNDKDFGEKIFRDRFPHNGVIFLRLQDERSASKIAVIEKLLQHHSESLSGRFVVVTESKIRIGKLS